MSQMIYILIYAVTFIGVDVMFLSGDPGIHIRPLSLFVSFLNFAVDVAQDLLMLWDSLPFNKISCYLLHDLTISRAYSGRPWTCRRNPTAIVTVMLNITFLMLYVAPIKNTFAEVIVLRWSTGEVLAVRGLRSVI
ncbi:hypothetical protein BKA93DRAFT_155737 [Sparassis latifolia]